MSQCENYVTLNIRDLCKLFAENNPLWNDLVAASYPKPHCPLKIGSLKITNATVDLSYVGYMPIAGYTFTSIFKLYKSITNVRYKKHMLFCIMFETPVTKTRREQARGSSKSN